MKVATRNRALHPGERCGRLLMGMQRLESTTETLFSVSVMRAQFGAAQIGLSCVRHWARDEINKRSEGIVSVQAAVKQAIYRRTGFNFGEHAPGGLVDRSKLQD